MDGDRFDALARSLVSVHSRRGVIGAILGLGTAGAVGRLGRDAAARQLPGTCRRIGAACSDSRPCCPTDSPCTENACLPVPFLPMRRCFHRVLPAGTSCPTDNNRCTDDVCDGHGRCTHPPAVTCAPPDACHQQGVCNPATGACGYAPKPDGNPCSDGNACTNTDTCQNGRCTPGTDVVCQPQPCHAPGVCNPATGACEDTPLADGTACDDGDLCTPNDVCKAGRCVPGDAVSCTQDRPCADVRCDPASGKCDLIVPHQDGTDCDDGDLCTGPDICRAGECVPGNRTVCDQPDACHESGICNPQTGTCTFEPKTDGTSCGPCRECQSGSCQPVPAATICAAQGKNCDSIPDGCGGTVDCGTCSAPQTCGGGGVANVCGCSTTTCAAQNAVCGTVSDGCGGTLNCGTCDGGFVCCGGRCLLGACCNDSDCGGSRHCCSGLCLDCCRDSDCGTDAFCDVGTCTPICHTNDECPTDFRCCPPGSVSQPGSCARCCDNTDCTGGLSCCGAICQARCE